MSNTSLIIPQDKINLLKDTICRGASDNELELFMNICNKTNLDPFAKQCWAVKRWDTNLGREVLSFQTGVDGFRLIADRSTKYSGQLGPFWCGEDGKWLDVWLDSKPPIAAKVAVLRSDFTEPLWAVAKFSSYAAKKKDGSLTTFWLKMPELMIAKVAECLALRKAFPQDLSGIYSDTEMDQAEIKDIKIQEPVYTKISEKLEDYKTISTLPNSAPKVVYASKQEIDLIFNKIKELNVDPNEAKSAIFDLWKLSSSAYLRPQHAKVLLELLNATKDKDDFKFQVEAYYNFLNPK